MKEAGVHSAHAFKYKKPDVLYINFSSPDYNYQITANHFYMKDYINAFRNIFNYKDEATLKEFWNFFMVNIIMNVILRLLVKRNVLPEYLHNSYAIIVLLALIAVGFRRLKNAGYSGWLFLIPVVNLFFALLPQKEIKES